MLREILAAYSFVDKIDVVSGSIAALNLANQIQPDVMLIDASITFDEASVLVLNLKKQSPRTQLVVITDTTQQRRRIAQAGADYALLSFNFESQISEIIHQVMVRLSDGQDHPETTFKMDPGTSD